MTTHGLEIAIIGMAGRFPGAPNLDVFWENLKQGLESIVHYSDADLEQWGVPRSLLDHPQYIKASAPLAEIDQFDADFFGFNPREAEILDPQHRLFLECAWEALEQAGYDAEQYGGTIAVYGGAAMNSYLLNLYNNATIRQTVDPYQIFLASDKDFLTTRVSYKLNLSGPSLDIQTACSTSLVSVHVACQSLLGGECDVALAGGVAVSQPTGYLYQEGGIYSPDGHCRAFDAAAQGTVSGSGVGIVVLKRLEDAIADRDTIHAVIKGSAINNDGSKKVSYTAPSIAAQTSVIRAAQQIADVQPDSISYVETHGTGTAMGDPIEIAALSQVFQAQTSSKQYCAIASLKPNIGHLDTAAGIASLIKTVLAIKHQQIPPSLHFQTPNPQINFEQSPFYVNTQLSDWHGIRRAGVSSFGIGGTNTHVILESAPELVQTSIASPDQSATQVSTIPQLLLLSAKSKTALDQASQNLLNHLQQHPHLNLSDVAHTLQVGRRGFSHRRLLTCRTVEEAIVQLKQSTQPYHNATTPPAIAFLFPGQGSQYINMARHLYETNSNFRQTIDHCSTHLKLYLPDILYPSQPVVTSSLTATSLAQPALFIIEYALAQLWISWGVQPDVMIGHSIGEYVAACLAGVFSLEDALKLVALRGEQMQQQPAGSMLSVSLSEVELQPWLGSEITLSVHNTPQLCVVSGTEAAIAKLKQDLTAANINCQLLHTSHAFHSPLMADVQAPLMDALRSIQLAPPTIPFVSNVTGTWITVEQATDPRYWIEHLMRPVRFTEGLTTLLQNPHSVLLEVGPGQTLITMAKQVSPDTPMIASLPSAQAIANATLSSSSQMSEPSQAQTLEQLTLINAVGQLWLQGATIRWSVYQGDAPPAQRIPLPTYPFERQRYWIDAQSEFLERSHSKVEASEPQILQPNLNTNTSSSDQPSWLYQTTWERCLPISTSSSPLLKQCWLLLGDTPLVEAIAHALQQADHDVIQVKLSDHFGQDGYRIFTLNPHQPEDYQALLADLQKRELLPTRMVQLWQDPSSGFDSLLFFTQAIAAYTIPTQTNTHTIEDLQITILTDRAQEITGAEIVNIHQAKLIGLAQIITQEYPYHCHCIDIELKNSPLLVEQIIAELRQVSGDRLVAYRHHHRWRRQFQSVSETAAYPWRSQGHYVIVGDLENGLGQIWAVQLWQQQQAKLTVITGATLPDHLQDWISQTGSLLITANITDQDDMQAAIAQAESHFGTIHGVFYATPMSSAKSMGLIADLSVEQCQYNFMTKVDGLEVLQQVFAERSPDFCLLQSSLSSIVGGLGLGAYGAANCSIDAFGQAMQSSVSTKWHSVNWDACQSIDLLSPSGVSTEPTHQPSLPMGLLDEATLTPDEVWTATTAILAGAPGQTIVSKVNLQQRIEQAFVRSEVRRDRPMEVNSEQINLSKAHHRPYLTTDYVAPRNETEQQIAQIWQDLLGIDQVGIYDSFFELGGHSLLAIQAIARLRSTFQVDLPMRDFLFEAPTVAGIATAIANQLANQLSSQQPNDEELAAMAAILHEVQALSAESIQQQLAEIEPVSGG